MQNSRCEYKSDDPACQRDIAGDIAEHLIMTGNPLFNNTRKDLKQPLFIANMRLS